MAAERRPLRRKRRRRDFGRIVAMLLCILFALIGALPLSLGLILRAPQVRELAAREISELLRRELGINASFQVDLRAWPLSAEVKDLRIDASDGRGPALEVARLSVVPRLFSLIAGKIDAGDIEIDGPRIRLVIEEGEVRNIDYRLPEIEDSDAQRAPFSSLSITDAQVDLTIDGYSLQGVDIDIDVEAHYGQSFEIALRAGEQSIVHKGPDPSFEPDRPQATFDDLVCHLDARLQLDPNGVFIRRFDLLGAVDLDPLPDTFVGCALDRDDERRLELSLSHIRAQLPTEDEPLEAEGRVALRVPVALTNRFVPFLPVRGWVGLDVEGHYDGRHILPEFRGQLTGGGLELERYRLAKELAAHIEVSADKIRSDTLELSMADGTIRIEKAHIDPFAPGGRLQIGSLDVSGVRFPGLMRDLGVTEETVVAWGIDEVYATQIEGRFDPLRIDGDLKANTSGFAVFDRSFDDPEREQMIGVDEAKLAGRFKVRPDALIFSGMRATFGDSLIETTVSIGFHNDIFLEVYPTSRVDLSDVSPIGKLEMAGRASLGVIMEGQFDDPLLLGDVSVNDLSLAGFPFGDVSSAKVRFRPLVLEFLDVEGKKNESSFRSKHARLDFGGASALLAEADVEASRISLHDFFHMWHFDQDPRFAGLAGEGRASAKIRYDLGGPLDRCRSGFLDIHGEVQLSNAELFDERYDEASAAFHYLWIDPEASDLGLHVDIPSLTLKKGRGHIFGSAAIRPGGNIFANIAADDIALSRIQGLGPLGILMGGRASATARVSGTLDELEADVAVRISPVQVGTAELPGSELYVKLAPERREKKPIGKTFCGYPTFGPFDRAEYERDLSAGTFHTTGKLFGGQIAFDDFRITRQRQKRASGRVDTKELDLGAFASMAIAGKSEAPEGRLSGSLDIENLSFDALDEARASLKIDELSVGSSELQLALRSGAPLITIGDNRLNLPEIALDLSSRTGLRASLLAVGEVKSLADDPDLDISIGIPTTDLAALSGLLPRVDRASGKLEAKVKVTGSPTAPLLSGGAHLEDGELSVRGMPALLSDVNADIVIGGGEVRLSRAVANLGGGSVSMTGNAPLHGFELGDVTASIIANGVHLPIANGIRLALDANLLAALHMPTDNEEPRLPRITGDITLTSFSYTRPISIVEDLGSMAQRSRRTVFDAYDPLEDFISFDLRLRSREPLRLRNNLVEAQFVVDSESLALVGTNQRFGMRGQLRVLPQGRVRLRANEFEVRQGWISFDDLTRIAPRVDVMAVTEYRRYSSSADAQAGASAGASADSAAVMGNAGGSFRISLHAYGDADDLRLDMTSDPPLSQEDIALLLYIGMTRAELDQLQASSLGETAALEALSALSGADSVLKEAVPVIDDVRLGSAYSSRTGRTEPTITVGKRVTEDVRASVTSGLSDNREVRSNLEWRLTPKVSVQGSYDNVNDVSSSSLGNLGVDIRYRIELE